MMVRITGSAIGKIAARTSRRIVPVAMLVTALLLVVGCVKKTVQTPTATPPAKTYRGPRIFEGTVGSMVRILPADTRPIVVSNYWVVVGLDGTGSRDVPKAIEARLISDLGRLGLGWQRLNTGHLTPRRLLEHSSTTVVTVEGLVPAGATRGDPIDLLVTAVQPLTTSLAGGRLFMNVELAPNGMESDFSHPSVNAGGAIYLNPFEDDLTKLERHAKSRMAVVLSGGEVTRDRPIRLVLNQSNWRLSGIIADRINENFGRDLDHGDKLETAVAKTESLISIHVPTRWRGRTSLFLGLIMHSYVQRESVFANTQAEVLAQQLLKQPDDIPFAQHVALAWEAMGANVLPLIGQYYDHPKLNVRLAALQAGSHLHDERTSRPLARLALAANPVQRRQAAELMVHLPDSLVARHSLETLLDDADRSVRIVAYKALVDNGNMDLTKRIVFRTENKKLKFVLDIVQAKQPLIFITQTRLPRIVVFNSYTGFKPDTVASLWDRQMMIKTGPGQQPATVYYLEPGKTKGRRTPMLPFVANLVRYMAQLDTYDQQGLDLSYSRIVNALYQLHRDGQIDADMEVEPAALAKMVASYREGGPAPRPETQPPDEDRVVRRTH